MKHLVLPIKKKWYDMILSGEKKEEYRELKDYYRTRFAHLFIDINTGETMRPERLDEWLVTSVRFKRFIIFRNGYRTDSPSFGATCTFKIGAGQPEWGAEPGKKYYVLKIERIMRDYKPIFFVKQFQNIRRDISYERNQNDPDGGVASTSGEPEERPR